MINFIQTLLNYRAEKNKWRAAGKPFRSANKIKELYSICEKCPLFVKEGGHFDGYDKCDKCGCNLHSSNLEFNKLAWATTKCPDDPPRWKEDV